MESNKEQVVDTIVEAVISKIRTRSEIGIAKYGITLDRTDYSTIDWIDAAIEEQMDNILYLTRLKQDIRIMEEKMAAIKKESADIKARSIKYLPIGTKVDNDTVPAQDKPKPNYLKYGWHY